VENKNIMPTSVGEKQNATVVRDQDTKERNNREEK
jgi:hypothetical protein